MRCDRGKKERLSKNCPEKEFTHDVNEQKMNFSILKPQLK